MTRNNAQLTDEQQAVWEKLQLTRIELENRVEWHNGKGERHRLYGPAVEWYDGTKWWFLNDKRHRLYGPAVECGNGYKEWYVNGKRHRIDGPAIVYANGDKAWWVNGQHLTKEEFNALYQQHHNEYQ